MEIIFLNKILPQADFSVNLSGIKKRAQETRARLIIRTKISARVGFCVDFWRGLCLCFG